MNFRRAETAVSKILIVDDHTEMRRMTKFFLRDLPCSFEECTDVADALDCYEKTRPDWVLMDWEMRRMDGLTATRRIIEKHPQAKILMVTQYDDEQLKEATAKARARFYIKGKFDGFAAANYFERLRNSGRGKTHYEQSGTNETKHRVKRRINWRL